MVVFFAWVLVVVIICYFVTNGLANNYGQRYMWLRYIFGILVIAIMLVIGVLIWYQY